MNQDHESMVNEGKLKWQKISITTYVYLYSTIGRRYYCQYHLLLVGL